MLLLKLSIDIGLASYIMRSRTVYICGDEKKSDLLSSCARKYPMELFPFEPVI